MEERVSEEGRVDTTKVIDPIFIVPVAKRMGHMKKMTAEFHGIRSKKISNIRKKTKVNLQNQQKVIHLNLPITLLLTTI
jgi:hypothetical protein